MTQMTLAHLNASVRSLVAELRIGEGSVNRSSAYHDYVALELAVFVTPWVVSRIEKHFQALCDTHGWQCLRVTVGRGNSVIVTMYERAVITATDRRMPDGDAVAA